MNEAAVMESRPPETLDFEASDVTGTHVVEARDVQCSLPASAVATSLADSMQLPANVPWVLRDDRTSRFLDDARPIGDQIKPGAHVTIAPKTHLGGR